jgi:hypothetical protein
MLLAGVLGAKECEGKGFVVAPIEGRDFGWEFQGSS